jgi:hypothetical protein
MLGGDEYVTGQRAKLLLLERVLDDLFGQCDVVVQTDPVPFDIIGLPEFALPIGFNNRVPIAPFLAASRMRMVGCCRLRRHTRRSATGTCAGHRIHLVRRPRQPLWTVRPGSHDVGRPGGLQPIQAVAGSPRASRRRSPSDIDRWMLRRKIPSDHTRQSQ